MYVFIIVFRLSHSRSFRWWTGSFWDVSLWSVCIFCQYCSLTELIFFIGWLFQAIMLPVQDSVGAIPVSWNICIKSDLKPKTILTVYADFPADFIKSAAYMTLICILDQRMLYSVFCELLEMGKYWILLPHIRSVLWKKCVSLPNQVSNGCRKIGTSGGLRFFHKVSHNVDFNSQTGVQGSVARTGTWKQYTFVKAPKTIGLFFKTIHFHLLGWG